MYATACQGARVHRERREVLGTAVVVMQGMSSQNDVRLMDAKGQNWPKYFYENMDKSDFWPKKEEKGQTRPNIWPQ